MGAETVAIAKPTNVYSHNGMMRRGSGSIFAPA